MKKQIMLVSLFCLSLLYGCGGNNKTSTTASTNSPVTTTITTTVTEAIEAAILNNKKATLPSAQFIGVFEGDVYSTKTQITINANGSISVARLGSPTDSRLFYLNNSKFYIMNPYPTVSSGVEIQSNGSTLILVGTNYSLSKR